MQRLTRTFQIIFAAKIKVINVPLLIIYLVCLRVGLGGGFIMHFYSLVYPQAAIRGHYLKFSNVTYLCIH